LEILYPKIFVHVRGTCIKGTRYKYRYRYEVHVQVHVQGTYEVQVRGTGTGRYRYRYEVQVRGTSIHIQVSFVNACTFGTRGNTKEGTSTGTRYRYRYSYGLDEQVWVYKSVVRQKLVKKL
jgi:hypothetical protein